MKTRVISGIGIAVVLIITLLLGGYVLLGTLLAVSMIGYFELVRALDVIKDNKANALSVIGMIGICFHYTLLLFFESNKTYLISIMFVFLALMICFVLKYPKYHANQVISAFFAFVYVPVMLSFIYLLRVMDNGEYFVWMPFVAWICDTFAYLCGRAFGKHKMAPVLSPNKTIEGAIGGIIFSCIAGAIFALVVANDNAVPPKIFEYVIITFVAAIVSQIGDLAASAIKRDKKIKDYGDLIPGHGGIMDRFDSVIFVTPFIYLLVVFILIW